jgi:ATP-dependent DNA ligase
MTFDLLYRDRRDPTGRPLHDRRARLEDVVAGSELVHSVRRLAPDGQEAWKQLIERGYEGYVAKDEPAWTTAGRGAVGCSKMSWTARGGPMAEADSRGGHS